MNKLKTTMALTAIMCASAAAADAPQLRKAVKNFTQMLSAQKASRGGSAAANLPFNGSTLDYTKPTSISLGWHTSTANNCGWFAAPSGDQWFFILPDNSTELIAAANNVYVSVGIAPTCSHGFRFFWHVTDSATGAFDQIYGIDTP
jgi:hypothetical protein